MKVSTKGRYGLRIMMDIAGHCENGPVAIREISARQNITVKYTEQIVIKLVKSGFLRSERGAQGGYALIKTPKEYVVGDILRSVEGDWAPVQCVHGVDCSMREHCTTATFWNGFYQAVNEYVDRFTLQDLLDQTTKEGEAYNI
ncbi:MAG: Rrf2 family transcriptional regulator [Clostridia bacterium]|nr:Rrf2 family transcriptional regulator [Clostridia bacterium]